MFFARDNFKVNGSSNKNWLLDAFVQWTNGEQVNTDLDVLAEVSRALVVVFVSGPFS